jgi:hypothetical protein
MNSREGHELTRDEERAREAIRSLPSVAADSRFRERLKVDFAAGRLAGEHHQVQKPLSIGLRLFRPSFLVPAAAAAVLLIAVVTLRQGPTLELADVTGSGVVTVDGQPYQTTDRRGLERALRPGARVEVPDGIEIDVLHPDTVVYELAAATMTLPRSPDSWSGKTAECRLESGEVRVLTGPGFGEGRLIVMTPEGMIHVTGTLVSVVSDTSGTCVCVHHGTVRVGIDAADLEPIPAGQRKVMFADERPPIITEIAPPHREHLVEFEAKYHSGIR